MKSATSLILRTGFPRKAYEALLAEAQKSRKQKRKMKKLSPFDSSPIPEGIFDKRWRVPELLAKPCIWAIPAEDSCLDTPDHFWMTTEPLLLQLRSLDGIYVINGDFFRKELGRRKADAFSEGKKWSDDDMRRLYRDWAKTCISYDKYATAQQKYKKPIFLIGRPLSIKELCPQRG